MLGKTHRAFGFAMSTAALVAVHKALPSIRDASVMESLIRVSAAQVSAVMVSTLPDIDQWFGTHRGITHAVWAPATLLYATYILQPQPFLSMLAFGAFLGYLSHLLGDAFSNAGVAWLYPLQGYEYYSGGAFHVKGFRGPFIPLYKVGDSVYSFMPAVWWVLGAIGTYLLWGMVIR